MKYKNLSTLSTEDMRKEMSIAGSPEKITDIMTEINSTMSSKLDFTNPSELLNMQFALQRLRAEIFIRIEQLEKSNNQKYIL